MGDATTQQDDIVTFGIGCFAFEFTRDLPRTVTLTVWKDEVTKALLGISTVTNVVVTLPDRPWVDADAPFALPARPHFGAPEPQHFVPTPSDAKVAFELVVPKRLHRELLMDEGPLDCEKFRVETLYAFHGPCTFVTCLDAPDDGSLAVRLLWRFLEREIPLHSKTIKFTNLGPSPFHAFFTVRLAHDGGDLPRWQSLGRVGYDDVEVEVDAGTCSGDIEVATRRVQYRLSDEASLFYSIVIDSNYANSFSAHLHERAQVLIALHRQSGFRAFVRRTFRLGSYARALGLDAMALRADIDGRVKDHRDSLRDVYSQTLTIGCLRERLEEQLLSLETAAFDNALEVVQFLEGGRSKDMEIAVIATSTLLGGLAGAAAAVLAR